MKFRILLIALLLASPIAHATSFNCAKAATYVEKTICSDATLGKLDDALTGNYNAMLATDLGDGGASLKKEQRAWLAQRNKCTTDKCLIDLYRKRVDDVCDAPVVTGIHAACVQSGDISAGSAAPATQGGAQSANVHVIGTIKDGGVLITLTDKHSCKDCEFEAKTSAQDMDASWNYTDIDGIIEVTESDGVHPADERKYTLGQDVRLTAFGKKFIGPAND